MRFTRIELKINKEQSAAGIKSGSLDSLAPLIESLNSRVIFCMSTDPKLGTFSCFESDSRTGVGSGVYLLSANTRPQPAEPIAITCILTVDSDSGTLTGGLVFYNPYTSSDHEGAPSSLTVYIQGVPPCRRVRHIYRERPYLLR